MASIPSSLEIAQAAELRPIGEVAADLSLEADELEPYGRYKGKVDLSVLERLRREPDGKLVFVTAITPTPAGDWFSVAVHTPGDYGIEKGLIFSYPIRTTGTQWEIVQGVPLNDFSKAKIAATEAELKEEKSLVADLLPK